MQSHSCQLKSGLSAHMTDSSFLAKCLFLSTGLPLPSKKAKFPATCPCRPRRRRVPTGGPPASIGLPLPSKKAKFPATCPCSPRRRRVPTGGPPAFTGFPLPSKKAKFSATCPLRPRRRRVPTGGPPASTGLPLPSRKQNPQPSAHIALTVGASRPEVRERRCASAF